MDSKLRLRYARDAWRRNATMEMQDWVLVILGDLLDRLEALEQSAGEMETKSSLKATVSTEGQPDTSNIYSPTFYLVRADRPGQWTTMATGTLAALSSRLDRGLLPSILPGEACALVTPAMWELLSRSGFKRLPTPAGAAAGPTAGMSEVGESGPAGPDCPACRAVHWMHTEVSS